MKHKRQRYHSSKTKAHMATPGGWTRLPHIVLVEIFKNLTDCDRIASAQVCHHWKDAFESPVLWRQREFEFGGSRFRPLGQTAIRYVKKFGRHLHQTKINCRQLTSHTCQSMMGNLETFLEQLSTCSPPRLKSLEISGLELDFWRYSDLRDHISHCLVKFFETQTNLETLNMSNAQFPLYLGMNVLEAVARGNGDSMHTLMLDHFFQSRQHVYQTTHFNNAMEKFSRLHIVDINYCCLSDRLVSTWAATIKGGQLKRLRIHCCDNEPHHHSIASSSWRTLASACPLLNVEVCMLGIGPSDEILPILSPSMPLKAATIFTGYDNGNELGLSVLLTSLVSRFHRTLCHLELEFDNYHDNINDQLVLLVSRCHRLTSLKIKARIAIEVARYVYQTVKDGKTGLKTVEIMLCDISPLEMAQLHDLRSEVDDLPQQTGIELILRDDLYA